MVVLHCQTGVWSEHEFVNPYGNPWKWFFKASSWITVGLHGGCNLMHNFHSQHVYYSFTVCPIICMHNIQSHPPMHNFHSQHVYYSFTVCPICMHTGAHDRGKRERRRRSVKCPHINGNFCRVPTLPDMLFIVSLHNEGTTCGLWRTSLDLVPQWLNEGKECLYHWS